MSEEQRVRISVEKVIECERFRREVNKLDLSLIDFTQDGKVLDIPQKYREDWRFMGLNNWGFIADGFYQEGWTRLLIPDEEKVIKSLGFKQDERRRNVWFTPLDEDHASHRVERTQELFVWCWGDGYGHFKTDSFSTFDELMTWLNSIGDWKEEDKKPVLGSSTEDELEPLI